MSKSQEMTNLQCLNHRLLIIRGGVRLAEAGIMHQIAWAMVQKLQGVSSGVRSADSCIIRRRNVILAQVTLRHDNLDLKYE